MNGISLKALGDVFFINSSKTLETTVFMESKNNRQESKYPVCYFYTNIFGNRKVNYQSKELSFQFNEAGEK